MLRSMMYVTTPSGCSLRRAELASMPMPMRSSDWNMSSACCLVRVMTSRSRLLQTRHHSIGVDAFDPNLLSRNFVAGNALLFGAHVLVLTPESQVLKQA